MSQPAAGAEYDPYAHRYLIALGVILGAVMELIDTSIVNVAISDMSANLGVTIDEITWVVVGYILSAVIVLPMTGWLASYFGRRRYFLTSVAIFTVASFFCGTSRTLGELVFWRLAQGLGGGALIATAQAILFDAFPPHQKTTAAAIFGLGMIVGPAIGPTLGGIIVTHYSWPWIFFINLPVGILSFFVVSMFVHDHIELRKPGRIDLVGIALLAVGIGSLQFVLERGEHYDWFDSRLIVALTVTAVACLLSMIAWELHVDEPILDLRVLKDRSLAAGSLFAFALGAGLYGSIFAEPLFMQQILHYDAETAGLLLLSGAVASAAMMMPMARFGDRIDVRWSIAAGSLLLAYSMWMHSHLTAGVAESTWHWLIVTRGAALGMIFVPLTASAVAGLRGRALGHGSAVFNLTRQLGGSLGLSLLATYLTRDAAQNRADLVTHATSTGYGTYLRLQAMQRAFMARGSDFFTARQQALAALDGVVNLQSYVIAFEHVFLWVGVAILAALPLVPLLRRPGHTGVGGH
ncbi:MAG: DHA2 family efflux MFS transporter permease subunit [Gemmatimonadota bacterium]|nr:DHA2 family efflux MFS transporter permease subunit [Gemmatimonadota bacterium]MDE3172388.1 DHA2 family efflux MFS transporter permease subunit [Gemmatimonadota bacterium]MDE3214996.1 DHA2 family efflux MFS transporter permease subunit [Gemmatimonadota bacterium]